MTYASGQIIRATDFNELAWGTPIVAPVNTLVPVISGTAQVGQILTCTYDGTWTSAVAVTYSHQWKRGATSVGTNSASYTLVGTDNAATMTCIVTATNSAGGTNATSNPLGPVTDVTAPDVPTNVQTSNYATTSMTVTWTAPYDNVGVTAYEVFRDTNPNGGYSTSVGTTATTTINATSLPGSTSGITYYFKVKARDAAGNWSTLSAYGSGTTTPTATPPVNTSLPVISGLAQAGNTLTCSTGTWSGTAATYTYQWKLDNTNYGPSSTSPSKTLSPYLPTQIVSCDVTATNAAAPGGITVTAAPVVPHNTTPPSVTGYQYAGAVCTCNPGAWTGTAPITYLYNWRYGSGDVWSLGLGTGHDQSLTVTGVLVGTALTCTVTGVNAACSEAAAASNWTSSAVPHSQTYTAGSWTWAVPSTIVASSVSLSGYGGSGTGGGTAQYLSGGLATTPAGNMATPSRPGGLTIDDYTGPMSSALSTVLGQLNAGAPTSRALSPSNNSVVSTFTVPGWSDEGGGPITILFGGFSGIYNIVNYASYYLGPTYYGGYANTLVEVWYEYSASAGAASTFGSYSFPGYISTPSTTTYSNLNYTYPGSVNIYVPTGGSITVTWMTTS